MRVTEKHHREQPWRVHELAADFELLDVWQFKLKSKGRPEVDRFLAAVWSAFDDIAESRLSQYRFWLGERFGWDARPGTLAIPGCTELSVTERLSADERSRSRPAPLPVSAPKAGLSPVYRFEDEALFEVSNDTIHALIHLGWAGAQPEMAVYIKTRGFMSRLYMAGISPFRHVVVYPALIRSVRRHWEEGAVP